LKNRKNSSKVIAEGQNQVTKVSSVAFAEIDRDIETMLMLGGGNF
jgi:hypothetical protein